MNQQIYGHPGQPTQPPRPDMRGFAVTYERAGGNPAHIMKCFSPERVPTVRALAKNYLVCDNWFSSVPGPTNPNRAFAHFGTSFGRRRQRPGMARGRQLVATKRASTVDCAIAAGHQRSTTTACRAGRSG